MTPHAGGPEYKRLCPDDKKKNSNLLLPHLNTSYKQPHWTSLYIASVSSQVGVCEFDRFVNRWERAGSGCQATSMNASKSTGIPTSNPTFSIQQLKEHFFPPPVGISWLICVQNNRLHIDLWRWLIQIWKGSIIIKWKKIKFFPTHIELNSLNIKF